MEEIEWEELSGGSVDSKYDLFDEMIGRLRFADRGDEAIGGWRNVGRRIVVG